MFANLTSGLNFHATALALRAERQRLVASNIANADTPGYVGRDINFRAALVEATQATAKAAPVPATMQTHPHHMAGSPSGIPTTSLTAQAYTVQTQPSVDRNSVDLDRERATFADNAVRYEATLRFINGYSKTILSAIQGQ
jgi:flagellar basal-body rod protein FlgB